MLSSAECNAVQQPKIKSRNVGWVRTGLLSIEECKLIKNRSESEPGGLKFKWGYVVSGLKFWSLYILHGSEEMHNNTCRLKRAVVRRKVEMKRINIYEVMVKKNVPWNTKQKMWSLIQNVPGWMNVLRYTVISKWVWCRQALKTPYGGCSTEIKCIFIWILALWAITLMRFLTICQRWFNMRSANSSTDNKSCATQIPLNLQPVTMPEW